MLISDIKLPMINNNLWGIHNAILEQHESIQTGIAAVLPTYNTIQSLVSPITLANQRPSIYNSGITTAVASTPLAVINHSAVINAHTFWNSNHLIGVYNQNISAINSLATPMGVLSAVESFNDSQGIFPFLNNRFAWIGAIENFQQVVSNMALATDIVADKFALDFSREEILPLFKELDEKVVAGIIANGDNVDVPVQQLNLIEKLLKHENIIAWIQGLIMASFDLSISAPICFVICLLLDCFKNKHKS